MEVEMTDERLETTLLLFRLKKKRNKSSQLTAVLPEAESCT